jgi:6-aminohexanoate-oligomer exohydrolase
MKPTNVTWDNWQEGPANRWSFQHVDEVATTAAVPRGNGPVMELATEQPRWGSEIDGALDRTFTDGLIVLQGREILLERYLNGMAPTTRHLLQSVSKSMCAAIFGRYVSFGDILVDSPVRTYLPELAESAYGDATIQQVLDMTAAVEYNEEYTNPDSEVQTHDRVGGWRTPRVGDPADAYEFLAGLRKSGEHGRTFAYCSANTDVLAWVLERVSGRRYLELLTTDLWSRMGAEHDAYITVDRSGFPMANGGMCVTLRDLARFGRLMLDGVDKTAGSKVVPSEWVADIRRGGDEKAAAESMKDAHPHGSYRNQFWISGDEHGCFYGVGIYGQYVWMNPSTDTVVAKLSSLPEADGTKDWVEHVRMLDQLSCLVDLDPLS